MTPNPCHRFLKVVFRSEDANVGCLGRRVRGDRCYEWVLPFGNL